MRCVEPPPSATLNHSRSSVVGFFFQPPRKIYNAKTLAVTVLPQIYAHIYRLKKKKKSLLVWKNVQHTHLRKVKFVCRCSFPLKLHQHRWRLVSAPPFKQRGCCSLWHQLPQKQLRGTAGRSTSVPELTGRATRVVIKCSSAPNKLQSPNPALFGAESPLLIRPRVVCNDKGGWGVTWITRWIWTRFEPPLHSHLPKQPSVSAAYGNHAVMKCCLLCSLQGALLNIPQRICSLRGFTHRHLHKLWYIQKRLRTYTTSLNTPRLARLTGDAETQ